MQFIASLFPQRRVVLCLMVAGIPGVSLAASLSFSELPNLQKVNDQVYRGGQPAEEGFARLAALGVHTVVDLRWTGEHSQAREQKLVEASGMHYVSIPMKGMQKPAPESVDKVLALLNDSKAGPVFVHCQRGADRTGAVIACYRMQHDGWDRKQALDEAGKYGMSWFQMALKNFVDHFQPVAATATATAAP
jgi:protein tyrosine/serine phosphatase